MRPRTAPRSGASPSTRARRVARRARARRRPRCARRARPRSGGRSRRSPCSRSRAAGAARAPRSGLGRAPPRGRWEWPRRARPPAAAGRDSARRGSGWRGPPANAPPRCARRSRGTRRATPADDSSKARSPLSRYWSAAAVSRRAAARAGRSVAAPLAPEELCDAVEIRAVGRIVDGVWDVDAAADGHPVDRRCAVSGADRRGDARVGVGLVPDLAREDRREVLVARGAHCAPRVHDLRSAPAR